MRQIQIDGVITANLATAMSPAISGRISFKLGQDVQASEGFPHLGPGLVDRAKCTVRSLLFMQLAWFQEAHLDDEANEEQPKKLSDRALCEST